MRKHHLNSHTHSPDVWVPGVTHQVISPNHMWASCSVHQSGCFDPGRVWKVTSGSIKTDFHCCCLQSNVVSPHHYEFSCLFYTCVQANSSFVSKLSLQFPTYCSISLVVNIPQKPFGAKALSDSFGSVHTFVPSLRVHAVKSGLAGTPRESIHYYMFACIRIILFFLKKKKKKKKKKHDQKQKKISRI